MANNQPVRLAYNSYEPVSGADPDLVPIIFLHGCTAFKEHWGDIPQIVANASRRNAYAVDARNHGDSEWNDYFTFDVNVEDLIHFMDKRGIRKAILVGHSMGGTTAIKTALKRPDVVEKIVVEDMPVRRVSQQIVDTVLSYVKMARKSIETAPSGLDEDGVKDHIMKFNLENLPPGLLEMKKAALEPEDMKRLFKLRRGEDGRFHFKANLEVIEKALQDADMLSSEPEGLFEGQACFIFGKMSPFLVGADEHHIKQFFPNTDFVGIEDATHDVHSEQPLKFTEALLKFIS